MTTSFWTKHVCEWRAAINGQSGTGSARCWLGRTSHGKLGALPHSRMHRYQATARHPPTQPPASAAVIASGCKGGTQLVRTGGGSGPDLHP